MKITGAERRRSAARRPGAALVVPCEASSTPDGYRCHRCRVAWDRDDVRQCALLDQPENSLVLERRLLEAESLAVTTSISKFH